MSTVWIVTLEYIGGKQDDTEFYLEPAAHTYYDSYPAERIARKTLSRRVTDTQIMEEHRT